MRILHVNNIDIVGSRFNGHDMQRTLNKQGINAKQMVMEQLGDDPNTILLARGFEEPFLRHHCMQFERDNSIHGLIYPYSWRIMQHQEFKKASVVHYHLLHNYFGSLALFPEMTALKPSVLTVHDPWIFTGHCVYPMECDRWMSGCGNCPNLNLIFKMQNDNTSHMWKIKKAAYESSDLDLVVASDFMLDMVRRSPITSHIEQVHLIPFGIDTDLFTEKPDIKELRNKYHIDPNGFTLFFRADHSPYKGLPIILDMIKKLDLKTQFNVVTVGEKGIVPKRPGKYKLYDFGWVTDDKKLAELFALSDVFLMPSSAEAFGLMAIEAMASAKPLIVADGTSLPKVSFAPDCGVAIPQGDADKFAAVVTRLSRSPEECEKRGNLGRELVKKHYRYEQYVENHVKLYEQIIERKSKQEKGRKVV